jgi:hypothetical protein
MSEEKRLNKIIGDCSYDLYLIVDKLSKEAYPLSISEKNYKLRLDYAIKAISLARTILIDFKIDEDEAIRSET